MIVTQCLFNNLSIEKTAIQGCMKTDSAKFHKYIQKHRYMNPLASSKQK